MEQERISENKAHPAQKHEWKEVASSIAATLLLFMPMVVFPMLGVFVSAFTPLPTLLSIYRWGIPMGLVVPAGATIGALAILSVLDMLQGMIYFSEMILMGVLLAMGMRRHLSVEKTVAGAALLVFVISSSIFWTSMDGTGWGIFTQLEQELKDSIAAILKDHDAIGVGTAGIEQRVKEYASILVRLLPGIALASSIIVAWLNLLLAVRYFRRLSVPLPPWESWTTWKSPEPVVWPFIAAGFMLLAPPQWVKIVGMNGLIAMGTIYLFQGLSIVVFFFERWKMPRPLRAFIYGLLFLQQFATVAVVMLGLFDIWVDFRRLTAKSAPGTPT